MDLYAFAIIQDSRVKDYINKNYGEVPRMRGVRFMKVENKQDDSSKQLDLFNKYVGQDVIYIHTRCGNCGVDPSDDNYSNYTQYGAKDWEEKHPDLFLGNCTDEFDNTYCDHYFKAIINDNYNEIIKLFQKDE